MNVGELIEYLKNINPESRVWIQNELGFTENIVITEIDDDVYLEEWK
ncbi:hypothetical protein [Paenibacillus cremeus]|nr:hypothetical protein [Paenibacillus cremeus]